jgi:hypothetical protein
VTCLLATDPGAGTGSLPARASYHAQCRGESRKPRRIWTGAHRDAGGINDSRPSVAQPTSGVRTNTVD